MIRDKKLKQLSTESRNQRETTSCFKQLPQLAFLIDCNIFLYCPKVQCKMVYSRRDLKVISIIQIVMTVIFFVLGMVDRFQVRFRHTSFLLAPCWIAALVSTLRCVDRNPSPSFNVLSESSLLNS